MSAQVDIAGCDAEPIHIPGAVQPHGALLCLRESSLEVVQASDNLQALLGIAAPHVGVPLDALIGSAPADALRAALPPRDDEPALLGRFDLGGRACDVIVHRHAGALFVELEPGSDALAPPHKSFDLLQAFVARLREADTLEAICRTAALEVRRLTGFGQTLVYAFDEEGHGRVLAEDRDARYPSYLGHHFPASDIPQQARELYRRNHVRLIADADYRPAPLQPALHPDTGRPTDLSFAGLRSVSPVHLEYMRHMGTRASMSVSVIVAGELWGLISCHDAAPRFVPYAMRTAFEHLGQVLSLKIEGLEDRREIDRRLQLRARLMSLVAAMGRTDGTLDHLVELGDDLLAFGAAGGAAVVVGGRCRAVGAVPDQPALLELAAWLARKGDDVFATDRLAEVYAPAREWVGTGCGLLAVAVSKLHRNYVLWFRPEVQQTIRWAGDPRQAKVAAADGRLHPRLSFASWQELRRGRSAPWRPSELEAAVEFRNAMVGNVLRKAEEVAALAGELKRSNAELEAFSYSVSHDLRAPLRHIAGYADLLIDGEGHALSARGLRYVRNMREAAGYAGTLVDGLLSFSRIGRTSLNMTRVDFNELVESVIRGAALDVKGEVEWHVERLPEVVGDPVLLKGALENLIGNALKYSAGRQPARIRISGVDHEDRHGVCIADNGVGFDMKYLHKLFGVFQRLHSMEDFEGTGIGLANVRRIAERHGGSVTAEGEVDRGATFTLLLPKTT
jgi:chemotaxis family two-component system sensor kinase Cph1